MSRSVLVAIVAGIVVLGVVAWVVLGWQGAAAVAGAAATVGAARRTVRGERRAVGRRHLEEVRGVEQFRERDRAASEPLPDGDDTAEQLRRIEDRAARRRGRGTGQAP